MNPIDYKYCQLAGTRLTQFEVKQSQPYRANFRCYVCGDSEKSKNKTRGWLLDKKGKAFYYCHNCNYSKPLWYFLRQFFPALYNDYVVDSKISNDIYKEPERKPLDALVERKTAFTKKGSPLRSIKKLSTLRWDHPARKYVESRKIPTNQHFRIYYAPKFKQWINSLMPNTFDKNVPEEPRLILPFIDTDGKVFGFSCRSFTSKTLRYITIMLDEDHSKVFGLEKVDFTKPYFIIEGALDSLFVPNSIAANGSSISETILKNTENAVYVYDNEPRNKQIVTNMYTAIANGYKVVIWPENIEQKDINDMVLKGYDPVNIISKNTYEGLQGELKLSFWRKI